LKGPVLERGLALCIFCPTLTLALSLREGEGTCIESTRISEIANMIIQTDRVHGWILPSPPLGGEGRVRGRWGRTGLRDGI